jgi:hypothetical protein
MVRSQLLTIAILAAAAAAVARPANAHFPWLATDAEGRALLFFGESPADRTYHTPDAVAHAQVVRLIGRAAPVELVMPAVETDEFVGRQSTDPVAAGGVLESQIRYGVYHGMLLDYYAKHVGGLGGRPVVSTLKLDASPRAAGDGLELVVLWDKQPLAKAKVTLIDAEGDMSDATTDAQGVAKFKAPKPGLIGFLIERMDPQATGELDGEKYASAAAYGTVTVNFDEKTAAAQPAETAGDDAAAAASGIPPLPEPVASFGAAVSDGWLYVYSGHIGAEHEHSRDNLSRHFRRVKLDDGAAWEELPMDQPLQGLPLVAHGGKLYRAGGLSFRNAADAEPDMHSVADFACFDPATHTWTALAPLPEARSSHDAAVIGDTLYVVGGWTLAGEREGKWLDTAWSFDLTQPQGQWQAVVSPTFKRRALAVAPWNGKLVAIGGMDEHAKPSRRVDALDLAAGQWSELPALPRAQMAGFGVSAWNLAGRLIVSGADGKAYQLADDGGAWLPVGKLATGRFFHRLLPMGDGGLLAIGGASPEEGHLTTIEQFRPAAAR